MVREKLRGVLPFRLCLELLEKLRHGAGVESRIVENLRSHDVGLRFRRSRVAEKHATGGERTELRQKSSASRPPENAAGNPEKPLRGLCLGGLVGAMPQGDMRKLVRHDSRQLRFVVGHLDGSAINENVSSGQGERVDGLVVHAMKFKGILHSIGR